MNDLFYHETRPACFKGLSNLYIFQTICFIMKHAGNFCKFPMLTECCWNFTNLGVNVAPFQNRLRGSGHGIGKMLFQYESLKFLNCYWFCWKHNLMFSK